MPHAPLAASFLGQYLLLRPGSTAGVQLPHGHFGQLAQAAAAGGSYPPWLAGLARQTWQLQLPTTASMDERVLVRQESPYGYGRASWEINLGCNYACSHCYLGLKEFSGLPWAGKERLLGMMRDAGVVWLQITGGEPTIDKDFPGAYRLAFELGMMVTVSTNGSRLWQPGLLGLFTTLPPYRLVISLYGATEAAYDGLTRRRGSYKAFRRGIAAAVEAGLPVRLNIVVTDVSADKTAAMAALAKEWGVPHNVYTNMTPTIYGGGESLLAQSAEHLRARKAFTGCNAGHTFFHADPHGKVSICKVGRDDQVDLAESHTRLPPGPVLADVARAHRQLQALLHGGRQRSRQTRELFRIDADLLAHASLLLDDVRDDASARAHGSVAALCAEEAGCSPALAFSAQAKTARWQGVRLGKREGTRHFRRSADLARRGFECSSRSPVSVLLANQEASAAALLGDAGRARRALRDADEAASGLPATDPGLSTWSCPRPRQALYALSVAIRFRDPDAALRAADMADAGWASGDPWLYGVWSLIRIGAGTAHVMKGDLDAAAGQLGAVTTLDPPFRIATITGYLADMDSLLAQRRFAGDREAEDLREQIRVFTAAACPAAPAAAPGLEGR